MLKNIFYTAICLAFSTTLFSQQCTSLGCAANKGTQNATSQPLINTTNLGCVAKSRQVFWQFVYSPTGGNYTQAFTPAGTQDLDWVVFDIGTTPPLGSQQACPVSTTGWTQTACSYTSTTGVTGPGTDGTATTISGHYYAIAVSVFSNGNYTFTIGTPQIGGANLNSSNCPSVLPLTLISFVGNVNSDNKYFLVWKTENEINLSHFEIISSYDGANWQFVENVAAKNNSTSTNFYSFSNTALLKGVVYLKLKMVGLDGRFTYSSVIILKSNSKNIEIVSTGINPVNDKLYYIIYAHKPTLAYIDIIDIIGRKIKEDRINLTVNNNTVSIQVNDILPGSYFFKITVPSAGSTTVNCFQKR